MCAEGRRLRQNWNTAPSQPGPSTSNSNDIIVPVIRERRTVNKCKGVKKQKVGRLSFQDYKEVLEKPSIHTGTQNVIRSFSHNIYSVQQKKAFFSSFDDKTFLLDCAIHSYNHGDYRIKELGSGCEKCGIKFSDQELQEILS